MRNFTAIQPSLVMHRQTESVGIKLFWAERITTRWEFCLWCHLMKCMNVRLFLRVTFFFVLFLKVLEFFISFLPADEPSM